MQCVELMKTSAPTNVKDAVERRFEKLSAQNAFEKFAKILESRDGYRGETPRKNVGDRVATLGSDGEIYCDDDNGIFSAVLVAYNNHWKLRTSPDDWWFCVVKKVSLAIDKNAEDQAVRNLFVEHEGKKNLTVDVDTPYIYDVDYSKFFEKMSREISKNVKVPEFLDTVTADFTSTTPTMKIVSQISIMSSLQQYFRYGMMTMCGIPAIEMLGSEYDWERLVEKLQALRKILEPISHRIGLTSDWWSHAEKVFTELLKTYRGSPDEEWWDKIIEYKGGRSGEVSGFFGWLTEFLEGTRGLVSSIYFTSGLLSVPLEIESPDGSQSDTACLVAGMLGFTLHKEEVPIVQPFQGWSLMLPDNSPFRFKTAA
ncbi:uncharacterized protein LOC114521684 [Dendronephthya gigantea]|uniref:uncharacterized protein LOC114521684 n=1 Tax=Dendronephthya gigantea TaxID=151771 RepID=UPI00106D0806|nr:uncharacterized protein LOC114521684 [Dendronephthya gigantea]